MPQVGETKIVRVKETRTYIWVQCPNCKQERWMQERNYKRGGSSGMCLQCFNKSRRAEMTRVKARASRKPKSVSIKQTRDREGYILVRLSHDDFFYSMATKNGDVREHRLVMAKHLNRCLLPWEVVHHKNGIKNDNRLENLELLPTNKYHLVDSKVKSYIRKLEDEIAKLKLPSPHPN